MAKSEGNILTLQQLKEQGIHPLDYRLFLLAAHYRKAIAFSVEEAQKSGEARKKLNQFVRNLQHCKGKQIIPGLEKQLAAFNQSFEESIRNDLNTPKALGVLFNLVRKYNAVVSSNSLQKVEAEQILSKLIHWNDVLAVMDFDDSHERLPTQWKELIEKRERLRKEKRFAEADEIRDQLVRQGIMVEDTPEGTKWSEIPE